MEYKEEEIIREVSSLISPEGLRKIAKSVGVTRRTVENHLNDCLVDQLANDLIREEIYLLVKIELQRICCQLLTFGNFYKSEINNMSAQMNVIVQLDSVGTNWVRTLG